MTTPPPDRDVERIVQQVFDAWPKHETLAQLIERAVVAGRTSGIADMLEQTAKAYTAGYAQAERDIVAWLRTGDECCVANAERVERGAHRKPAGE